MNGLPPVPDGPIADFRVTQDAQAVIGPLYFWGYHNSTTGAGGDEAWIHRGAHVGYPRYARIATDTNESCSLVLTRPVYFGEGLFVDIGVNVLDIVIFFQPVPGQPEPEPEPAAAAEGGE